MPPQEKSASDVGKRYPLNMRTTKEVRDKLEAAALASGRSLVQEVEFRIEKSFIEQDLVAKIDKLANRIEDIEDDVGDIEDRVTLDHVSINSLREDHERLRDRVLDRETVKEGAEAAAGDTQTVTRPDGSTAQVPRGYDFSRLGFVPDKREMEGRLKQRERKAAKDKP